jgi:NAD-dependent SIR2 family protein deacetylase
MSSVVKAKCPKCKNQVSVEEEESAQPVTCASCQSTFVPAAVIAESNQRFQIGMYVVMLLVGVGLIVYMAMTGNLKPKADAPEEPPAVEQGADNQ